MARIICVDVGSYSIKSLLMETSFNRYQLLDFHETVFPEEFRNIELGAGSGRSLIIKEHLESNYKKVEDFKVYALISGDKTIVKLIPFPFKDNVKIKQALNFELESYVPFQLHDWLVEHCINSTKGNESIVLSVLTHNNDMKGFLNDFSDTPFEPVKVSTDSIVLSNLHETGIYQETNYAFINIGHLKTNITTIENGTISLVRSVPVGGYHLTKAISRACNLNFEKAESKKHRDARAFSDEELENVKKNDLKYYTAILDFCYDLTRQLKQSIYSLKIQDKGMVTKIYLSGGTAKIRGIDKFISRELKVPVSDSLLSSIEGNKIGINFDKNLVPSVFATGLREISKKPVAEINFRKSDFAYTRGDEGKKKFIKRVASFSTFTACILLCLFMFKCNSLQNTEAKIYSKISKVLRRNFADVHKKLYKRKKKPDRRSMTKLIRIIRDKKGRIEKDLQLLEEVEKSGRSILDVLRDMSTKIPNDIKFDIFSLEFGSNKVALEANAPNLNAIAEIVKSLEISSSIKNVKESDTKASATGGGQDFKLRFDVE